MSNDLLLWKVLENIGVPVNTLDDMKDFRKFYAASRRTATPGHSQQKRSSKENYRCLCQQALPLRDHRFESALSFKPGVRKSW